MYEKLKNQTKILLATNPDAFIDVLNAIGYDGSAAIKTLISSNKIPHEFEIIEREPHAIKSIRKLSTGEVFTTGDKVWCTKYQHEIGPIYFDSTLMGEMIGHSFYINFVRDGSSSGLYKLSEIAVVDKAGIVNSDYQLV